MCNRLDIIFIRAVITAGDLVIVVSTTDALVIIKLLPVCPDWSGCWRCWLLIDGSVMDERLAWQCWCLWGSGCSSFCMLILIIDGLDFEGVAATGNGTGEIRG